LVRNRLLRSEADLASLLELYTKIRSGKRVKDDDTNPLCGILRLSGAVRVEGEDLKVRNRIYDRVFDREWVTAHMPDAELRRQRAAYRRGMARAMAVAGLVMAAMAGLSFWAVRNEWEARRNLYVADMNLGQQALQDGDLARLGNLLARHRPQPGGGDLRGFEWRYLWSAYRRRSLPIVGSRGGRVLSVAFSPDRPLLAIGREDGSVELWDVASGRHRRQSAPAAHGGPVTGAVFSRNGRLLATGSSDGTVKLWSILRKELVGTLRVPPSDGVGVAFSHEHELLAAGAGRSVILWNVAGGAEVGRLEVPEGEGVSCLAFSPRGRLLATGNGGGGVVRLWDAVSRRLVARLRGHEPGMIHSVAFVPEGGTLASAGFDQTARLWDVATGRLVDTLREQRGMCRAVAFLPDGRTVATAGDDRVVKLWDARSGQRIASMAGHVGAIFSLAFSPDRRTLASGCEDHTVKLWSTEIRQAVASFQEHERPVRAVAFSPDGTILASTGDDGTVRLRRAATLAEADARSGVLARE
jgi:WD40 repeat protein